MARFYLPRPRLEGNRLVLQGNEVRHLRNSLRLRQGDDLIVFDGEGREYEGRILRVEPTSALIEIRQINLSLKESPLEVTLAQSLLKGEKMDYLVQKATELGVKRIIPFLSSRSIPLLERSKETERVRRWERIAIEASKQSGRGFIPKIEPPWPFSEMLRSTPREGLRMVLNEKGGRRLKEVLRESPEKRSVFFIVGPEGGLSEKETEAALDCGFLPVVLGGRILRAETASLCLLSILQYEWGDIG
ncbi:MAG: 16S rRNA (uracil(1498)-N(3))-methyltransferase [Desulfobacterota bacterium]|nr:16S rRNA (uracil(1498)-N(3))-methyltransferase [Thermodesulfobacteriota bacterium]